MDEAMVLYEVGATGVATLRLNHPARRNALSVELLDALIGGFERARDDPGVRCVVLASADPRVFSSGADLRGFVGPGPLAAKHDEAGRFVRLFELIGRLGKPTVCAVAGAALGGAVGVVLACDLAIAGAEAVFATPELGVGAFPFMVAALLYRNLPRRTATEMLLLGERLTAAEAAAAGIVNRVVAPADLDAAVADWADRLAAAPPLAMRLGKEAIWRQMDMGLLDALDYLRAQLTIAVSTDDLREGVGAFLDHRDPEWKGR
jgi:enoyl-CoA hydratase/carnithine racemase